MWPLDLSLPFEPDHDFPFVARVPWSPLRPFFVLLGVGLFDVCLLFVIAGVSFLTGVCCLLWLFLVVLFFMNMHIYSFSLYFPFFLFGTVMFSFILAAKNFLEVSFTLGSSYSDVCMRLI